MWWGSTSPYLSVPCGEVLKGYRVTLHAILSPNLNQTFGSSPHDTANLLAIHFSAISSDENYDNHFRAIKSQSEALPINFDPDLHEEP